jgi:hypothetical protein
MRPPAADWAVPPSVQKAFSPASAAHASSRICPQSRAEVTYANGVTPAALKCKVYGLGSSEYFKG